MATATRLDSSLDFQLAKHEGYHWTTILPGLEVVRIPARNDEEPEFALLKMSNDWYLEVKRDPKEFLEKYEIFERRLNGVTLVEPVQPSVSLSAGDGEGYWFLWPSHTKICVVHMSAYYSAPGSWKNR